MKIEKVQQSAIGRWASVGAALLLFAAAYLIMNYAIIVEAVLYRAAANDFASSLSAVVALAGQAIILLVALALLQGIFRWLLLAIVAGSAFINKAYSLIVGGTLDAQKIDWMLAEAGQVKNAAAQFAGMFATSALQVALAIILLIAARRFLGHVAWVHRNRGALIGVILIAAPSLVMPWTGLGPLGAERNLYNFAAAQITRDPPPLRRTVTISPARNAGIEKIIWLVDESVAYEPFRSTLAPMLERYDPSDFGEAAAMGNCSTPSNVALRSGVDVRNASDTLDLRAMPTIWGYARRAGYRTTLVDGQTRGAPQNMLQGAELAMVDRYRSMEEGIDTDRGIAKYLNSELRLDGRQFIYVVLRGVHFQYADHIPSDLRDPLWSNAETYRAALAYSKKQFFEVLLDGLDRQRTAIVYTSDHGQNLTPGSLPHCSRDPVRSEFAVPLIAFLPSTFESKPTTSSPNHSLSQIFPSTLQWMGYPAAYAQDKYDNDLRSPTARYVWFGRNVVPVNQDDRIEISTSTDFPGR